MVMYGYFRKEAAFVIDRRFAVRTCWTDRPSARKKRLCQRLLAISACSHGASRTSKVYFAFESLSVQWRRTGVPLLRHWCSSITVWLAVFCERCQASPPSASQFGSQKTARYLLGLYLQKIASYFCMLSGTKQRAMLVQFSAFHFALFQNPIQSVLCIRKLVCKL